MAFDIKEEIEKLAKKVTSDKTLLDRFQKEPVKTVEGLIGVDLPDDVVEKVVTGVKAKIGADKLAGAAEMLKKLF